MDLMIIIKTYIKKCVLRHLSGRRREINERQTGHPHKQEIHIGRDSSNIYGVYEKDTWRSGLSEEIDSEEPGSYSSTSSLMCLFYTYFTERVNR